VVSLFWFGPCLQPVAPVDTLAPPPTLSPPYVLPPSPSGHMCVSFRCLAGWPGRRPITYAPLHQPPESGGYSISSGPPHHASQFDVGAPPRKREMRWPLLCDVRGAPAAAEAADSRQAHAPSAATSDAFLLCTPVWSRTVFLDILSKSCSQEKSKPVLVLLPLCHPWRIVTLASSSVAMGLLIFDFRTPYPPYSTLREEELDRGLLGCVHLHL
jgi:hypothetical protein